MVMSALEQYARRVWNAGAVLLHPPAEGLSFSRQAARMVLHREGRFQAELIHFAPHLQVPDHCHPGVESIDVVLSGQFTVVRDGEVMVRRAKARTFGARAGLAAWFGRFLPIPAASVHGGHVGPEGACIISFQHWLRQMPTHIVEDWQGAPYAA